MLIIIKIKKSKEFDKKGDKTVNLELFLCLKMAQAILGGNHNCPEWAKIIRSRHCYDGWGYDCPGVFYSVIVLFIGYIVLKLTPMRFRGDRP